ncbi:hypothetical protein GOBAR_AA12599 [Gossypium barbadense]|uniref:Uncharacterized protein n=1 Tax=Gossypium barbadense TaxID=3634 RepID=A0A2P5XXJ4_GOSBA|nr:hypothetical protein GOBAR_AA12599 [Gossypium barbadense]
MIADPKSCDVLLVFVLFAIISSSSALVSTPYPKAISDLKEAVVKGLGFQADDFKISGFDLRDALVGHSVAYEFDIEIDNKVIPFKLLEDVNRWEYVDLPIFRVEEPARPGVENGLVEHKRISDNGLPVLAPFQLAGPMELWIQDAKDMRISLPARVQWLEGKKRWFHAEPACPRLLQIANKKGYFKLLKADVSAQTFVKIGFGIEKKLKEGDGFNLEGFPEWRTKPEIVSMHFEVLAKVDGETVIPERIMQVNPVAVEDAIAPRVLARNMTMSSTPVVYTPSNPFTL